VARGSAGAAGAGAGDDEGLGAHHAGQQRPADEARVGAGVVDERLQGVCGPLVGPGGAAIVLQFLVVLPGGAVARRSGSCGASCTSR